MDNMSKLQTNKRTGKRKEPLTILRLGVNKVRIPREAQGFP